MSSPERGGIIFKLMSLLCLLLLVGLVYLLRHPLLRAAGEFWVFSEQPEPADAIIVLGDDNYAGDRAGRAAELYWSRWAPRVVASGPMLRPYAGITELIARDLSERGVPPDAVIRFPHRADSTREEALALRQLVAERRWHHVLVVTSSYHTRRARYIYSRVFPSSVRVRIVAAPGSEYDPDRWWSSRRASKIFFHESVGMCLAWWELRHSESTEEPSVSPAPTRP